MKTFPRFAMVAALALAAWLTVTFHYVKAGQSDDYLPGLAQAFFPLILAAFLWAAWPVFPRSPLPWRILLRILAAMLAMGLWFLPSFIVVANFQLLLEGRV